MSRSGLAGLVAAALGWGSLAVSTTIALRGIGPLALLLGEVTIASALLLFATLASGRRLPRLSWRLLALGALQPGVAYLTFNFGVQRTSAAAAGLLLGMEAVFTIVLGIVVLGERPGRRVVGGVLLGILGVVIMSWQGGGHATLLGDGLVLLDALAAAGAVILASQLVAEIEPLPLTAIQFLVGLAMIAPVSGVGWASGAESLPKLPALGPIMALIVTGAIGTAGSFLIYTWALKRVRVSVAAIAVPLMPLCTLVLSVTVLGEPLTVSAGVAAVLILSGLALFATGGPREASHEDRPPLRRREPLAPQAPRACPNAGRVFGPKLDARRGARSKAQGRVPAPCENPRMTIRPARDYEVRSLRELVERAYGHYIERIGRRPSPIDDDYAEKIRERCVLVAHDDGLGGLIVLIIAGEPFWSRASRFTPTGKASASAGRSRLRGDLCAQAGPPPRAPACPTRPSP